MATIASLNVLLGMDTARFDKGAKRGRSSLDSITRSAFSLNNVLGAATQTGRLLSSVFGGVSQEAERMDEIGKLSDRTGFSTENLAALRYNADLSGVSISTLDAGLQKLSINLGKAAQKGGDADNAFKLLGLSANELIGLKPDDAFARIADQISKLPGPAEKSAAAVEVFGKSGAELLNILNQGSKGMAAMRAEADKLGLTFSRLDAAAIERANDELARAGKIFEGLQRQATVGAAPFAEASSKVFQDYINSLSSGFYDLDSSFIGQIRKSVENVTHELDNFDVTKQLEFEHATTKTAEALQAAADSAKKYASSVKALESVLSRHDSLIAQFATPDEQFKSRVAELEKAIADNDTALRSEIDANGLMPDSPDARERQVRIGTQRGQLEEALRRLRQEKDDDWLGKFFEGFDAAGDAAGKIKNPDELRLDAINDRMSFLRQSAFDRLTGNERSAAFEQGTSAAYSASFGANAVDKTDAEMLRLERELVTIQRKMLDRLPAPFSPAA